MIIQIKVYKNKYYKINLCMIGRQGIPLIFWDTFQGYALLFLNNLNLKFQGLDQILFH